MSSLFTYSFLDTQAGIQGPGLVVNIAAGAGVAEEGITVEPTTDIDKMDIGADGSGMHTLIANKSGKVTLRLLKTSPVNSQLSDALALQRLSGANWGQNTFSLVNHSSGDTIVGQQLAFAKVPVITYAKDPTMNEWTFNAVTLDVGLGAGVQA